MEVKPVVKPLGAIPVAPVQVKPVAVAPVIAQKVASPVSAEPIVKDTEVKSVTDISKEERLGDIKQAVEKVEEKKVEVKTETNVEPTSKKKQKGKVSDHLKPSAKGAEVKEGEIVKEDPPTKEVNGIVINYEDFKKDETAFIARLNAYPDKNVLIENMETDEIKCLQTLWEAGKGAVDRKSGEYVLAYDIYEDTLNKIFVKDIIDVTVNKYYDNVALDNPRYLGCYYNVYHKGRRVFDKINARTFDYLKGKGLIPKEHICTIDVNTRLRFFNKTIEQVNQDEFDRELKNKLRTANRFDQAYLNLDIEQLEM